MALEIKVANVWDSEIIRELAMKCGHLDVNSSYYYRAMIHLHPKSCLILRQYDKPIGYVLAVPNAEDAESKLFIWQIGLLPQARGKGLAAAMICYLVELMPKLRFIQATIDDTNHESLSMFDKVAVQFGATKTKKDFIIHDNLVEEPLYQFQLSNYGLARDEATKHLDSLKIQRG